MNNVIQFTPRPRRNMYMPLVLAWGTIAAALGAMNKTGAEHTIDPRVVIGGMNFQQFRRAGQFGVPFDVSSLQCPQDFVRGEVPNGWTRWAGIPARGMHVPRYEFMTVLNELCRVTGHVELKEKVLTSEYWLLCMGAPHIMSRARTTADGMALKIPIMVAGRKRVVTIEV